MNILKSHTTWGADKPTLLKIYRTLIRSKIDYGCMIYATAKNSILKLLDPVHNTAVRIATGAFKSSPVLSVLNEAGEPSLEERRQKLFLSYVIKLSS